MIFDESNVEADAKSHAISEYPKESCGVVIDGQYIPCENVADDPLGKFAISPASYPLDRPLQAVIHSHPDGKLEPTKSDMQGQLDSDVPWGLLTVNVDGVTSKVIWWGDGVPIPPLKGRPFRWGPSGSDGGGDCYALIKDWYKVERNIDLPEYPRSFAWWENGEAMYLENFAAAGFREITQREMEVGDIVLMKLPAKMPTPNHAAIYLGPTQGMLHHVQNRLSRQENITPWLKNITHFLRYEGTENG